MNTMNTANLTPLQRGLVEGLVIEFNKINPKPKADGSKRFTIDTIAECQKEESRFLETIKKHNLTMIKVFSNQFEEELKAFKKEFKKVLDIQIGYTYPYGNGTQHHTLETFKEIASKNLINCPDYNEMMLFFVSKTKKYTGDSRFNHCFGKKHIHLYVGFKTESVVYVLVSGKQVYANKIVGLEYRRADYLNKKGCTTKSTLDEFIQEEKSLQMDFVELVD